MNVARRQAEAPAVRIDDPACVRVLRASMMRAPEKLAWLVLWQASRGGRDRLVMTAAALAAEVGQTDAKAARGQLKNLLAHGLIDSAGPDRLGQWELWVLSLDEAGLPRRFDGDPQLEIEFEPTHPRTDRDDSAAAPLSESPDAHQGDVLALPADRFAKDGTNSEPPTAAPIEGGGRSLADEFAAARPAGRFAAARQSRGPFCRGAANSPAVLPRALLSELSEPSVPQVPQTFNFQRAAQPECERSIQSERSESARDERGKTARDFAAAESPAGNLGGAADAILGRLPTAGEQRARVEDLAAKIMAAVDCPKLRQAPCLRAAWAVIEGRAPLADLDAVLRSLEQARPTLRAPASAYFVAALKRVFAKRGVPWETGR